MASFRRSLHTRTTDASSSCHVLCCNLTDPAPSASMDNFRPARARPRQLIFCQMKSSIFLAAAALTIGSSAAFTAPLGAGACPAASTSLSMSKGDAEGSSGKTFAASALAAAYIMAGVVSTDAAFAMDAFDGSAAPAFADSSSVMIAARSGGRAGGRAAPRRVAPPAASTTVIKKQTTVIAPPPVVVGGGYGYGGYGYGGYGYDPTLSLGLSAVSAISNGMRESRQNQMIYEERAELSASREREQEMAARIRQLEMMQMQQAQQQGQAQPQVIIAQPPVQMQAAPAQP